MMSSTPFRLVWSQDFLGWAQRFRHPVKDLRVSLPRQRLEVKAREPHFYTTSNKKKHINKFIHIIIPPLMIELKQKIYMCVRETLFTFSDAWNLDVEFQRGMPFYNRKTEDISKTEAQGKLSDVKNTTNRREKN